ncbi:actin-related protein 10-like [Oppia nitens]|uniref:actin-related protein 10-like n=1 Tax=Oppia nitens TaxID=1686743 RepID=UPI0023DA6FAF|nr:actin-related protein 10-like [Oppia nitens]
MPLYEGIGIGSDKHSVVIELGQSFTKCGFVGEYSPRAIIRSQVFDTKLNKMVNIYSITDDKELYSALKEFIRVLYFRYLAVNPKDRRLVIVESMFTSSRFRNQLLKVLYLYYDIQALLIVPQHLVALATLGLSTALILDVGYKEAIAVPIIEGVTVVDGLQFAPLGGKSIHYRIMDELIQRRATIDHNNEQIVIAEPLNEDVLEDIKIRTCFVAPFERGVRLSQQKLDFEEGMSISAPPSNVLYPIDGQKVLNIPGSLRESVCEVLFEMYGDEHTIPTLIIDAILKCSLDSRRHLASNIIIIGGTSMLPGFRHRLLNELKALAKSNRYESKLHFHDFKFHTNPCPANYSSWLGAAIFASSDIVSTRSVTLEQYIKNNQKINDWSDWVPEKNR